VDQESFATCVVFSSQRGETTTYPHKTLTLLQICNRDLELTIPLWLVFIDESALAGCAIIPFSGSVMAGSTLKLGSLKNEIILLISHRHAMIVGTETLWCSNVEEAALNSGDQPGSATVPAVLQARCDRKSRISAEQIRSVADYGWRNSKISDHEEEPCAPPVSART
jgi:hypothetical protein